MSNEAFEKQFIKKKNLLMLVAVFLCFIFYFGGFYITKL